MATSAASAGSLVCSRDHAGRAPGVAADRRHGDERAVAGGPRGVGDLGRRQLTETSALQLSAPGFIAGETQSALGETDAPEFALARLHDPHALDAPDQRRLRQHCLDDHLRRPRIAPPAQRKLAACAGARQFIERALSTASSAALPVPSRLPSRSCAGSVLALAKPDFRDLDVGIGRHR